MQFRKVPFLPSFLPSLARISFLVLGVILFSNSGGAGGQAGDVPTSQKGPCVNAVLYTGPVNTGECSLSCSTDICPGSYGGQYSNLASGYCEGFYGPCSSVLPSPQWTVQYYICRGVGGACPLGERKCQFVPDGPPVLVTVNDCQ